MAPRTRAAAKAESAAPPHDEPQSTKKKSADESQSFFRYQLAPFGLVTVLPLLILLITDTMLDPELDGSLVALGRALLEHGTRRSIFQRALAPPQTLEEVKVLSIFLVFQAVILVVLPGRRFTGPVAPSGHTPSYRENGLLHFAITLGGYFLVTHKLGLLPAGWIYDHLRQVMWILNVFGLLLSAALYVKGLYAPSTPDSGSSGNIWMDFYWGTELYPRVFGVDLKQLFICRGGMILWCLFAISFLEKHIVLAGGLASANPGQLVSVSLATIYIAKFAYWEKHYLHAADIAVDRFGYMLVWGTLCFMPLIHTLQNLYLVAHPGLALSYSTCALLFVGGITCTILNYDSDTQRHRVRSSNGNCTVWGRPPTLIRAEYKTADGVKHTNLLLASGYHGLARHFHYLPDIIQLAIYAFPAGFSRFLPWTYFFYLTTLLVDRTWRIDEKCLIKYGKAYEEYMRMVPYRLIPYLW